MSRLVAHVTCALCGHKAGNLVPHLESDHSDVSLESYMEQNGGDISCVIHPAVLAKTEGGVMASEKVMVAGVELRRRNCAADLKNLVPKVDENYFFQELTEDVVMDLEVENPARPVMLIGHTGTGKTSLFQQIAARMKQPLLRVNLNHQTTISDFVGMWGVKAGETYWIDGVLPYAMKKGLWLVLDEIDFADPAILSVINGVLEPGEGLCLKEKGSEVVEAHPNFRLCATANAVGALAEYRALYQGTNIMNEAFLNRWECYVVPYMPEDAEAKVLEKSIPMMPMTVSKELVKVANAVRKAFEEETVRCTFSTRMLLDWGRKIIRHRKHREQAPFKAAESVIFSKIAREDAMAIKGFMQRILLGRD